MTPNPKDNPEKSPSSDQISTECSTKRLSFLDGCRGWGALMVVFSHTFQCFLLNETLMSKRDMKHVLLFINMTPLGVLMDGALAVFIFFIVSGIALSYPILNSSEPRHALAILSSFRYFRLMIPIFSSSLFVSVLWYFGAFSNTTAGRISSSEWLESFYTFQPGLVNLIKFSLFEVFFSYNSKTSYNAVLWTMPVELLGSFALFSFLALPCNLGVRRAIALMWCILSTKSSYFGFPAGFLIATAFLSNLRELERSGFGPIFLIAGLSLALTMRSPLAESLAFLDVAQWKNLTALFLVAGTAFTPWARTLMSNSWSLFWGRLSFPIYLVHLPIICSVGSETYILLQSRLSFWMVVLSVGGAVLCSSVITALLFDIVVERKLLRSARRLHRLAIAGILTPRSKGLM